MKNWFILIAIVLSVKSFAQANSEVHLVDMVTVDGKITLSNPRNISNNEGYDNQPSFYDDNTIIFSSTRNGQTDIAKYSIPTDSISWVTNTPLGNEYSPLRMPNSENISAVRLDTTGIQRLYSNNIKNDSTSVLIEDLKVGYHVWDNEEQLVTAVLVKGGMNLMLNYLPEKKNNTIDESIGRTLHKIPDTTLISFVHMESGIGTISSYDPTSGEIEKIMNMPSFAKDLCWTNDGAILIANDNKIMFSYPYEHKSGTVHEFQDKEIVNITRMEVSPNGKHLVFVSDGAPETTIQKQLETFNTKNLDLFATYFSDSVTVRDFPNNTLYSGRKILKENYERHMATHPNSQIEVVKRIVLDDFIIDEQIVRENGAELHQGVIYELDNGEIVNMTFIRDNHINNTPESIVDKQHEAYNLRGFAMFLNYYSDDVEGYIFPDKLDFKRKVTMENKYTSLFEKALSVNSKIKNRIVIGNIVIDKKITTLGKSTFNEIAIYEVVNNLIKKVTFIR